MDVIVGSPWIPLEWIMAHGIRPRALGLITSPPTQVRAGICAFADSTVNALAAQPQRAAILTTSCDQLRRTADRLVETSASKIFLFNLPSTWNTDTARDLYAAEVYRLSEFLVKIGGQRPSDNELAKCLQSTSDRRQQLTAQVGQVNAHWFAKAVLDYLSAEEDRVSSPPGFPRQDCIPIALAGGPLSVADLDLIDSLEAAGARVAINGTYTGERALLPPIEECGDAPLPSMITHYWNHWVDVSQRPNTRLHDWFRRRTNKSPVRGLVIWQNVGCDLWRAEAPSLASALNLPILILENHDGGSRSAREQTRIEAFLEMLH